MANQTQVNILRQGAEAWNAWRDAHPNTKINLRGARLKGCNLDGANLRDADIRGARFRNAYLTKANFTRARAGTSWPETGAMCLLAALHGTVTGWFLCMAGLFYAAIFTVVLPNRAMTLWVWLALAAVVAGLTASAILGVRRGKIVTAEARSRAVNAFVAGAGAWFVAVILLAVVSGTGAASAAGVAVATMLGAVAAALAAIWTGLAATAPVAALVVYAGAALTTAVVGVTVAAGFVFPARAAQVTATETVALTVMAGVSAISAYIGWRTRREDPQFSLLRAVGLNLMTAFGTDFLGATLTNAVFDEARLPYARFVKVELTNVSWRAARHAQFARFSGTILADPVVRELLLSRNGAGQVLRGKNLHGANLTDANLRGTDLRETDLIQANLSGADITGAKLYGSARENWLINGVLCECVYWDEAGEKRTPTEHKFKPGEFEDIYKQLPTFTFYFERGFTPFDSLILEQVVRAINDRQPEITVQLDSLHSRAVFTVRHHDNVAEVRQAVTAEYETRLKVLEGQKDQLMQVIALLGAGSIRFETVGGNVTIQQVQGHVTGNVTGQDASQTTQRSITVGRDYFEQVENSKVITGETAIKQNTADVVSTVTDTSAIQESHDDKTP